MSPRQRSGYNPPMLYPLLRPALFALEAETAHALSLSLLEAAHALRLDRLAFHPPQGKPVRAMGLAFPNPVGLAAGFDKDGAHVDALGSLGFGFIEVGTVTPRPQPGNPRPRLFRLPEAQAIINRMGFNNAGIDAVLANLARARYRGVLGINIGKNFDTPLARAAEDYLTCLRKAYPRADYVAINVSSPNTAGLRDLQAEEALDALLAELAAERERLSDAHGRRVPLAVKIAPDLDAAGIQAIARLLLKHGLDAVIATNTTVARPQLDGHPLAREAGGLSGAPLRPAATRAVRLLSATLAGALPIIAVGGILSGADAREKLEAGATLVQVYTGLVYRGPGLVAELLRATAAAREA